MSTKKRLDELLLDCGLVTSLKEAQALIITGNVLVNDQKIEKPGTLTKSPCRISILKRPNRYVSRGAKKLEGTLNQFNIPINGKIALDIGQSTGGFTDVLIQNGAKQVIGMDVGYGILDEKLRQDPRVITLDRFNAKQLSQSTLETALAKYKLTIEYFQNVEIVVMDVSFISITQILPKLPAFTASDCQYIVLVKPQFEATSDEIEPGGLISNPETHHRIIERVKKQLSPQFRIVNENLSPIKGPKGNQEVFLHLIHASTES